MAAGLRASRPGMEVQINPPGRRKVSDMIWLVAEPLLESAPNFELKQMILNLTALAWNFTLLDPTAQEELLVKIADLFVLRGDGDVPLPCGPYGASLPRRRPRHLQGRNGARTIRRCRAASCVGDVRVPEPPPRQ
jgi:hypothetical protein